MKKKKKNKDEWVGVCYFRYQDLKKRRHDKEKMANQRKSMQSSKQPSAGKKIIETAQKLAEYTGRKE